ncbi:MAG TPA: TonB-dependent receptor, partial [Caulobacteraceae bacterium]
MLRQRPDSQRSQWLQSTALTLAVGSALAAAGAAEAQTAPPPHAAAPVDGASAVPEIVVTATGHRESLQSVPYNISAVSGQQLTSRAITDVYLLSQSVPGLVSADTGPRGGLASSLIIRGLSVEPGGAVTFTSGLTPTVATYVDSTPIFANLYITDVDRVEILRGPQGTLYGASSSAGTVRFIYNKPRFDQFTAEGAVGVSSTDHADRPNYDFSATVNAPISQTLAFRLNLNEDGDAGFISAPNRFALDAAGAPRLITPSDPLGSLAQAAPAKDVNWDSTASIRGALRWKPNEVFDATLTIQHQLQKSGGPQEDSFGVYRPSQLLTSAEVAEPFRSTVDLASLEMEGHLGFATLTSSTSYYSTDAEGVNDLTGFYQSFPFYTAVYGASPRPLFDDNVSNSSHSIVQEVRLTSNEGGAVKWVVGGFYQDKTTATSDYQFARGYTDFYNACSVAATSIPCGFGTFYPAITNYGPIVNQQDLDYVSQGLTHFTDAALFGEGEWEILHGWKVTGGLRLFRQTLSSTETGGLLFVGPGAVATTTGQRSLTGADYKVGTSYKFSSAIMAYAILSEGQRPGGVNALPTSTDIYGPVVRTEQALFTFAPDKVTNREVGIKGDLFRRFKYTLTYFNMAWDHVQVETDVTDLLIGAVINAGNAKSQGVEAELQASLTNRLTASIGYTYDDAKITRV